jgi:hypothetical protein
VAATKHVQPARRLLYLAWQPQPTFEVAVVKPPSKKLPLPSRKLPEPSKLPNPDQKVAVREILHVSCAGTNVEHSRRTFRRNSLIRLETGQVGCRVTGYGSGRWRADRRLFAGLLWAWRRG